MMGMMRGRAKQSARGVTVLEVLIAVFVLLFGMTGVIALFPVGVRFSEKSADDVISSMTAQNALAAVRVQLGLGDRVAPYTATNTDGDVLSWKDGASRGVDGGKGSIVTVRDEFGTNTNRYTHLGVTYVGSAVDVDTFKDRVFADTDDDRALMLMTSGKATWKLYRLDRDSTVNSQVSSTKNGVTNFPGDGILKDDDVQLIGARDDVGEWATVPARFYESGAPYTLGKGSVDGYGYLAIINRVEDNDLAYRVTILVYKGYNEELPPEGNKPAVACYVTILSGDLLR